MNAWPAKEKSLKPEKESCKRFRFFQISHNMVFRFWFARCCLLVSLSPSLSWPIYPTVGVNAWQECIWMCVRPLHACCCPMLCFASFWPGGKFIKMVLLWTSRSTGATAADGIETGKQTRYSKTTCSNWRQSAKDSQRQKYWKTLRKPLKNSTRVTKFGDMPGPLRTHYVPGSKCQHNLDTAEKTYGFTWAQHWYIRVAPKTCDWMSMSHGFAYALAILQLYGFDLHNLAQGSSYAECRIVRTLGSGYTAQLPLTTWRIMKGVLDSAHIMN